MGVENSLDRIIGLVDESHEKVKAKGGTTATPYLLANLPDAIESIPEAVDPVLQEKTVSPSTSAQSVTPDSGYDGLSKVNVNAMPSATQATPSISVSSAGVITASATQTAGYVAAGTKSATKSLTTQAAKTVTPSTSSQTAVASGRYTTGAVTVAAIPSSYVKPTATKGATTYTPSTSNQTIASGTYCSGAQTIKGDTNLVAGNIKSGVSIFGVAGSYEGSGGGSGGGGARLEGVDFRLKNGLNYVDIMYTVSQNSTGLRLWNSIPIAYMEDCFCLANSLFFIKTKNNPSICEVTGNLELIDFNPSVGAVILALPSDANAGIALTGDDGDDDDGDDGSSIANMVWFR